MRTRLFLGAGLAIAAAIAVGAGCSPEDRSFPGEGGAGGSGAAGGAGSGGSGGVAVPDFTFGIVPLTVNVPYDGINLVEVAITRSGGFDAPVEITADMPPPGLTVPPLTVPPGASRGEVQVGASGALTLGTAFTLRLVASGGGITRQAEVPATVTGRPGSLDTTFAGGTGVYSGAHSTDGGTLYDLMVMPDGKIVGSGDAFDNGGIHFFANRLLADGTIDASFDMDGEKLTNLCNCSGDYSRARAVGRQVNGKIITAGPRENQNQTHAAVVRHRDTGALDGPFFGDGTGKIIQDLGGTEEAWDLAITPDDRIVVVGVMNGNPLAMRFTAEGALDTTFAAPNGYATVAYPGVIRAITLDAEDRLVVAGSLTALGTVDAAVARFLPDGTADASFGGLGGATLLDVAGGADEAIGVALLADGRVVAAGHTGAPMSRDLVAWRLGPDGAPDPTFGMEGRVVIPLDGDDVASDLQLLPDGRIMIVANTAGGASPGPVIVRLRPDGAPDPTYGDMGVVRPYIGLNGHLNAMELLPDGKLLVAGDIEDGYPPRGVVARLWN